MLSDTVIIEPQTRVIPTWLSTILATLGMIGFFDALYLTAEHYLGEIPPCFIATGCEQVTTSQYSIIMGVPVALLGSIYYLVLFLLSIQLLQTKNAKYLNCILIISAVGFLATLYFVYLQLFVINAICSYCMISATTTTLIFLLSLYGRRFSRL